MPLHHAGVLCQRRIDMRVGRTENGNRRRAERSRDMLHARIDADGEVGFCKEREALRDRGLANGRNDISAVLPEQVFVVTKQRPLESGAEEDDMHTFLPGQRMDKCCHMRP